jgi:hypothetical protein
LKGCEGKNGAVKYFLNLYNAESQVYINKPSEIREYIKAFKTSLDNIWGMFTYYTQRCLEEIKNARKISRQSCG